MYPAEHKRPDEAFSYDRLDMLWEKYPQYHEMTVFSSLDELLSEHESWGKDFTEELREEYTAGDYGRFLVQLSRDDLPYRYETRRIIEEAGPFEENGMVKAFMAQYEGIDCGKKACFIFPESFASQFFVVTEVCKKAEAFYPVKNLFPDDEKVHYLAVFDKQDMESVLLMYHLLYTNASGELYGGYSIYDYSLPWYRDHLREGGIVLRSPYLPDRLAKYQGGLPFHHDPAKTVYVRRNIDHILECGYFASELEFFLNLIKVIMPLFQWWYADLMLYEEKDGYRTDWRLRRTEIRTDLTARRIIKPKWKNELTLLRAVRMVYPDALYQYRPEWLGKQSLDIYIPSVKTAIEYQGVQHYAAVDFFGGEEALSQRRELDSRKKKLCEENGVRLIEWSYKTDPTVRNIKSMLQGIITDNTAG